MERKLVNDLQELGKQLGRLVQNGVQGVGEDVEKIVQDIVQMALARLNVVTREEFDAQTQVLLRTQEKLLELERQLQALESAMNRST